MQEPVEAAPAEAAVGDLPTLCASAHAAISRLLRALPAAGGHRDDDHRAALAHQLALSSAAVLTFGKRLAFEAAAAGDAAGDAAGPRQHKRARVATSSGADARLPHTGSSLRLLDLPVNLLVDTAVAFVGARELSRLAVATSFVARTGFVGEVARRLQLRRPCWPQLLWRRRESVRALARGWGDAPAAVAQALRSMAAGAAGRGGGGWVGVRAVRAVRPHQAHSSSLPLLTGRRRTTARCLGSSAGWAASTSWRPPGRGPRPSSWPCACTAVRRRNRPGSRCSSAC